MEEEKIQRLHDTLAKLRKGVGLGISSQFNFGDSVGSELIATHKDKEGNVVRSDGLPLNGLYSNFVREGSANDPKEVARKNYGDGRKIKRNFDSEDDANSTASGSDNSDDRDSSSDDSSGGRDRRKKKRRRKEAKKAAKKEAKKAAKKAAKLEAKRQAKLAEKRAAKLDAKRLARNSCSASTKGSGTEKMTDRAAIKAKKKQKKGKKERKEKEKKKKRKREE